MPSGGDVVYAVLESAIHPPAATGVVFDVDRYRETANMPKKILLVDDHEMLRDAVAGALRGMGPECQIHGLGAGNAALNWIETHGQPDLVLLDIELPDGSGLGFLQTIRERYPTLRVAMLSGNDNSHSIQQAMAAGAAGFITKAVSAAALVMQVTEILNGIQSVTTAKPAWGAAAVEARSIEERYGLTKMQARVFELLLQGLRNRAIAEQLDIAEGTVKTHTNAIFKAMCVDSRAQLIAKVHQGGTE